MSYAEFSARKVAAACRAALADREKWVTEQRESRITQLMNKKRWFSKPYTREQAIKVMKSCPPESSIISEWDEYEWAGRLHCDRLKKLLALSESAPSGEDKVFVSAEDVFDLRRYLRKDFDLRSYYK